MGVICFDMDGTIADLYNVPNWLEKLQAEDVSPYREAKPLLDMDALREVVEALINRGWRCQIISWLAKDSSPQYQDAVRKAKLQWLGHYKFPYYRAHLIAYGTNKADYVRHLVNGAAILIDDDEKVRNRWDLGETINPETDDVIQRLWGLVNS